MNVPGTSLSPANLNYQAKHTEMESASGLVVLLIISPPDLPTVMGVDLRPEGTC